MQSRKKVSHIFRIKMATSLRERAKSYMDVHWFCTEYALSKGLLNTATSAPPYLNQPINLVLRNDMSSFSLIFVLVCFDYSSYVQMHVVLCAEMLQLKLHL